MSLKVRYVPKTYPLPHLDPTDQFYSKPLSPTNLAARLYVPRFPPFLSRSISPVFVALFVQMEDMNTALRQTMLGIF